MFGKFIYCRWIHLPVLCLQKTQFSCLIICTTHQLKPTSPEVVWFEESFFPCHTSCSSREGLRILMTSMGLLGSWHSVWYLSTRTFNLGQLICTIGLWERISCDPNVSDLRTISVKAEFLCGILNINKLGVISEDQYPVIICVLAAQAVGSVLFFWFSNNSNLLVRVSTYVAW